VQALSSANCEQSCAYSFSLEGTPAMQTTNANPPDQQFRYPEGMKVYAMVIDDRVPDPLIRVGLNALRLVDVDRLVFLCLASDDIRNRVAWEELAADVGSAIGKQDACEVRLVNSHEELMYASLHMRIVHLPESNAVHPLAA
jgi:hypothetical protein